MFAADELSIRPLFGIEQIQKAVFGTAPYVLWRGRRAGVFSYLIRVRSLHISSCPHDGQYKFHDQLGQAIRRPC